MSCSREPREVPGGRISPPSPRPLGHNSCRGRESCPMAWGPRSRAHRRRAVAQGRPSPRIARLERSEPPRRSGTSWICDSPRINAATTRSLTSKPMTLKPAFANPTASGRPTYPKPITPTVAVRFSIRSSKASLNNPAIATPPIQFRRFPASGCHECFTRATLDVSRICAVRQRPRWKIRLRATE